SDRGKSLSSEGSQLVEVNDHPVSVESPVGRLQRCYEKWDAVGANRYILDVIKKGYKLPMKYTPGSIELSNNKSARDNPEFVESEVKNLLAKSCIRQVGIKPYVVNPLTVAYNRKGKPRLVLDCRHINPSLFKFGFKYEDISVARHVFKRNEYVFCFDLKSAYHHISIFEPDTEFLGFKYVIDGVLCYFVFLCLPFGISTAGFIFSKLVREMVLKVLEIARSQNCYVS
ncbi:MAG: hypothetical protein ABW185_00020, partial [Sedimenticola sp.]